MKTKKRVSEPRGGQSHRPQVTPPRAVTRRDPPTAELQNLYLRHPSSERNRSGWCLSVSQYKAVIIHMTRITRTKRIRKNGCCRGPARAVPRRRRCRLPRVRGAPRGARGGLARLGGAGPRSRHTTASQDTSWFVDEIWRLRIRAVDELQQLEITRPVVL